ncbi:MAG TPA: DUF1501 domain-containing protein, partial [Verrucomicrobiales bacterium]|nr:DUF1501 domain-containing protein [Verrucomicrobiales bacterium]
MFPIIRSMPSSIFSRTRRNNWWKCIASFCQEIHVAVRLKLSCPCWKIPHHPEPTEKTWRMHCWPVANSGPYVNHEPPNLIIVMNRRDFLTTMGALSFLPGLLPGASILQNNQRSLILIWMDGGMSHIDTFDGKPEAPGNIRGDLVSMESSLEGVFLSEHLPQLSARMNKLSLIRSITSPEGNHDRGSCYMLTGRRPNPVLTYPSFGSIYGQGSL